MAARWIAIADTYSQITILLGSSVYVQFKINYICMYVLLLNVCSQWHLVAGIHYGSVCSELLGLNYSPQVTMQACINPADTKLILSVWIYFNVINIKPVFKRMDGEKGQKARKDGR